VSSSEVRYTTLALFTGLCIGASFWGTASDVIGRRLAFNMTLFLAGAFGLGVGGNLPVDGALFLEFLPFESGNLLTLLSVFWPVGQLISLLSKSIHLDGYMWLC
jgi:MFS family permease